MNVQMNLGLFAHFYFQIKWSTRFVVAWHGGIKADSATNDMLMILLEYGSKRPF
jgi:hypothetical protein